MEDITIDHKTLKALATDTRISILKHLSNRRMTQAELAAAIGISAPSVSEHMRSLEQAGLINSVDEGRKWKYFELTRKGSAIVRPSNTRVWFMLAISLIALSVAGSGLYAKLTVPIYADTEFSAMQGVANDDGVLAAGESQQAMQLPEGDQAAKAMAGVQDANAPPAPPEENTQAAATTGALEEQPPQLRALSLLDSMPLAETVAVLASVLAIGFALGLMFRERE